MSDVKENLTMRYKPSKKTGLDDHTNPKLEPLMEALKPVLHWLDSMYDGELGIHE